MPAEGGAKARPVLLAYILFVALLGAGCHRDEIPAAAALVPIPEPDLEALDKDARARVEARQRSFAATIDADADAGTRADAYGELGRQYFAFAFRDAAVACFENAVRLAPSTFRWHYYLGTLLQERGELDRAAGALREALELTPQDLPTRLHLGRVELDRGRVMAARQLFEQVLAEDPSVAAAHYHLGVIALGEKKTAAAIASLTAALQLAPEASAVHHSLGTAYRRTGDLDQAQHHLQQGGPERPRFDDPLLEDLSSLVTGARVHLQQAMKARNEGNLDLAVAHYGKAVALDPGHAVAAYNLGTTLGTLGRHAEALLHLDHAVELDPRHRDAHFGRASALTHLGRHAEAVEALETVLEIDPEDRVARYRLALVLNVLGEKGRAETELVALVASDPGDFEARLRLATLLGETGRGDEAAAQYAAVLEQESDNQEAHRGRVELLVGEQRYAEARHLLETGFELGLASGSPDAGLVQMLARLLATCPEPAVRDGARALELAQTAFARARTLEHAATVAMALAELGRFDEATAWQDSLVRQAEAAGLEAAKLSLMKTHLSLYEQGRPLRLGGGF